MISIIVKTLKFLKNNGFKSTFIKSFVESKNKLKIKFYKLVNKKEIKTPYGFNLSQNWNDVNFEWIVCGHYSKPYHKYLNDIKYPFIFIDIGANLGIFTLSAAQNRFCTKVFSFEPVLNTYEELKKNIIINKFQDKVVFKNNGISYISRPSQIFYNPAHSGSASLTRTDKGISKKETVFLINAKDLETLIPDSTKIIIKIDVEGHEEIVIKELLKCSFFKRVNSILYECHEEYTNKTKINSLLLTHGFKDFNDFYTNKTDVFYDVFVTK